MTDDDSCSVASAGSTQSASLEKKPCPHCNKDFQTRYLFNHIRVKHYAEFIESCAESHLKTSKIGRPLRVYYQFKDDRGDDDFLILYACLATGKAFLQEQRCITHFKKNPKVLKEHNAALKDLQDEYGSKDVYDPYKQKLERLKKSNDPKLCRQLWSGILYLQKTIQPIKNLLPSLNPEDISIQKGLMKYQKMTFKEAIFFIQETEDELTKLGQSHCLEWKPLNQLWVRFQRILSLRYDLPYTIESLWPKSGNNENGFEMPTDEFGLGSPDWEQVPF